jgi:multiple sugar transport system permease protein/putative chitobiose transport system permease protein
MKRQTLLNKVLIYALLIAVLLILVVPLLWSFSASLTPNELVFKNAFPFTLKAFIPTDFTLEAYQDIFESGFGRSIVNTLILSITNIIVGGVISALAGFAFATFKFRFKNVLFALILITFMIPPDMVAIPRYILVNRLGWLNSWPGLIVPLIANSLVIFLFRQFFEEIPLVLYDAARVDGANWGRIFVSIVLPISKPVMLSAGLILFLAQWEQFFWPMLVAPAAEMRVIQVAVQSLTVGEHQTVWNALFAGSIIAALIPIMLVLPFQRYYIQGIVGSGIKE